jgi:hypothetical protein
VQKDPLIGLGYLQSATHLLGRQALDVAHGDHRALHLRQLRDLRLDPLDRLVGGQRTLGLLPPAHRRRRPRARAGPGTDEAIGIDRGEIAVALLARERREGDRAPLALAARARAVDEDAEDPGAQRRALLEAVEALQRGQPRLLYDVLGDGRAGHVHARDAHHRWGPADDEVHERLFVAGPEALHQRVVVGHRGTVQRR